MADLKKTVELIFGGVDNTGTAISSVGRGLDSLVDKTGNVTGFLAGVTDSIVKLDLALAAVGETFDLPRGAALSLFALGRTAGLIAHAIEQQMRPGLIRPRARYTGPTPPTSR